MTRNNRHANGNVLLSLLGAAVLSLLVMIVVSCEREPKKHLHGGKGGDMDLPIVELDLEVYWDYELSYGIHYDWRSEWFYGWDDEDRELFGELGYVKPEVFNLRRYFTANIPYARHTNVDPTQIHGTHYSGVFNFGYYDILVWNDINTLDGVQSLIFDETTTLDSVTAFTNMSLVPSRHNTTTRYTRAFYQPEQLFSAYEQAIEINENLDGFVYNPETKKWVRTLKMMLEPITYIYLTQVILHNNKGRISNVDGSASLSGFARTVNLNTGVAGKDAITVSYNVRLKKNCYKHDEPVDIIGGRMFTFGLCQVNANRVTSRNDNGESYYDDHQRHYMDVNVQFNNGMDSTFVFDVTEQVRRRYKGGVITVELDVDTITIPKRAGGSGFDAVVKDYEDGGTYEFPM